MALWLATGALALALGLGGCGEGDVAVVNVGGALGAGSPADWNLAAVWISTATLGGTILNDTDVLSVHSTDGGATWSPPGPVNSDATLDQNDSAPSVGAAGGTVLAAWDGFDRTGLDYDVYVSRSTDGGASWGGWIAVADWSSGDGDGDDGIRTAGDGAGTWVAVWDSPRNGDGDVFYARSTDDGLSWAPATEAAPYMTTDTGSCDGARVFTDSAGTWIMAWHSNASVGSLGGDYDVLYVRSTDNGVTWSSRLSLGNAAGDLSTEADSAVDMATDGFGTWVAVWSSTEDFAAGGGTTGTDTDILVSVSTDNGATWTTRDLLNSEGALDGSAQDIKPRIAADGFGTWYAVWYADTVLGTGSDYDVFYAVSTDNGFTWSPMAALNANAAGDAGSDREPVLAAHPAGVAVATWRSTEDVGGIGTDADILYSRSTDYGATWSAPAPAHSNAAADGTAPDYTLDLTAW